MYNPYDYDPSPQSEEEYLARQEEYERREKRMRELEENNGEFRYVDPPPDTTTSTLWDDYAANWADMELPEGLRMPPKHANQLNLFDEEVA